jgi:hypothetical protein
MRNHPKRQRNKGYAKDGGLVPIQGEINSNHQEDKAEEKLNKWTRDQKIQALLLIAMIFYCTITYELWVTTREGVHSGQRAYLIVEKIKLDQPLTAGKEIHVRFDIRNTGQTPARSVRVSSMIDIVMGDPPPANTLPQPTQSSDIGASESGHFHNVRVNPPLKPDELADITKEMYTMKGNAFTMEVRGTRLLLYGLIRYIDVFGGEDETEFCVVYLPKSMQTVDSEGDHSFSNCTAPTRNRIK